MFTKRTDWTRRITCVLCLGCALAVGVGLLVEWQVSPEWESPWKVFHQVRVEHSWHLLVLAEIVQVALLALLSWAKKGRLLLGLTAVLVALTMAITFVRWQAALAYLVLASLTLLAGGMGRRILCALCPDSAPVGLERFLFAVILGYGILGFVAFGLALSHVLHFMVVVGVLLLLGILFFSDCKRLVHDAVGSLRSTWAAAQDADLRLPSVVTVLLSICFLSSLMVALSHDVEYDAMMYHLSVPERYILDGGLTDLPDCLFVHHCHGVEMLYMLGLITAGQPMPQLMHCFVGALTAALLFCLARRVAGTNAGWLAALFFYALPMTTFESSHAMSDLFLACYLLAAIHAAVLWIDTDHKGLLVVSGCFAGLAIGAKLNALFYIVPLEGLVLCRLLAVRPRQFQWLWGILPCAVITLGLWAPWLILEWCRTGNPIFPFCNDIFKSHLLGPRNGECSFLGLGFGHSLSAFIQLPWHLTAWSGRFDDGKWGCIEGLSLMCLPVTILFWPRSLWRLVWLPVAVLLGGIVLWFSRIQGIRYLYPIVPVMALCAAINAVTFWSLFANTTRKRIAIAGVALLAGLLWFQGCRWWAMKQTYRPDPYLMALGLKNSQDCLEEILPEYEPLCFLAGEAEKKEISVVAYPRHLRLYGGKCIFYHRAMTPEHPIQFGKRYVSVWDEAALAAACAEASVDYLLLTYDHGYNVDPQYRGTIMEPAFLAKHCRLLMTRKGWFQRRVCLYQFNRESVSSSASAP